MQLGMTLVRKRAVGKTSQALREGQPKLRQQMVELGDVAGVTAGDGTTTSSSTASGVAALQQGTGTTTTTAATGASFQMYFYLYFGVQKSPLLPPTPGSSYCFFLSSHDFDYLVTPTSKQQQTNNLHDEIDTTTHKRKYTNTHDDIGLNVFVSWIVMACQVLNCHARLWISSKAQTTIDSVFVSPKTTSRGIGKQFHGGLDPRCGKSGK